MAANNNKTTSTVDPPPHYADNPTAFPMEGGCCCGHVRYRVERAPMAVHCCHCTSCQRETGSAFAINLIIEAANLTVLPPAPATVPARRDAPDVFPAAGPPALSSSSSSSSPGGGEEEEEEEEAGAPARLLRAPIPQESGEAQTVSRCPRCFTAVWTEYGFGPTVQLVRGGTLDRAWLVQPDVVLFARSARPFVEVGGPGVPRFEGYYDRNEAWRPESLERWAALLPGIAKYRESLEKGSE